jgi:hypothetical protein
MTFFYPNVEQSCQIIILYTKVWWSGGGNLVTYKSSNIATKKIGYTKLVKNKCSTLN